MKKIVLAMLLVAAVTPSLKPLPRQLNRRRSKPPRRLQRLPRKKEIKDPPNTTPTGRRATAGCGGQG